MSRVEITPATNLAEPLELLEESLRDGEPVPRVFTDLLRNAIENEDIEILAAREKGQILGVLVLAYRLNVSAGYPFASIEDLHVRPEARRQGVGRTLLEAAEKRCTERDISYVEVQVDDGEAESFYTALGYEPQRGVSVLSRSLAIDFREVRADC